MRHVGRRKHGLGVGAGSYGFRNTLHAVIKVF